MSGWATCRTCGKRLPASEAVAHLFAEHINPEDVARWPDGEPVVYLEDPSEGEEQAREPEGPQP